ncbi:MAG: hypothetical protein RI958_2507 [Actinomycetota bacterium]
MIGVQPGRPKEGEPTRLSARIEAVAQLIPDDFDLADLPTSERRVCTALLQGLDDSWVVVPKVPLVENGHDAEIDIVVASPTHGAVLFEVKGGLIKVTDGTWMQYDRPLRVSPPEQVTRAKHMLVRRLKALGLDLRDLFITHAVALPDVGEIPAEGLGPDAPAETLFGSIELSRPAGPVTALVHEHHPIPAERFARFVRALRPNLVLQSADTALLPITIRRIDSETRARLGALQTLDSNGRVLVTGGAGSGKTWLVVEWARRAVARGERTAVITFNRPLADHLAWTLRDCGPSLVVTTYHELIRQLLEPHGFVISPQTDRSYWEHVPTQALLDHADVVGTPFDTVIVDEGQDMRPHWLPSIEMLIDPSAATPRLLMVADPTQAIYVDPWQPPTGMTTATLEHNLRSAHSVAQVVERLGGPRPLPESNGEVTVTHLRAGGKREVRKRVRSVIGSLVGDHGVPLSQIAVLTLRLDVRDDLLAAAAEDPDSLPLSRWEHRSEEHVLCETVHRGKGLERAAVIVVDITDAPEPQLVYIGASRATWSLTLVGTDALADVAGVAPQARPGGTADD